MADKVEKGGPGAVNLEALERAEQVIADLSDDYLGWVKEDMDRIQSGIDKLKSGDGDAKELLDSIFQTSHDIKGQGGSFGYDLMTTVGNDLCRFVEQIKEPTQKDTNILQLHLDTMRLIINQKIKGDGGDLGEKLLSGLDLVIQKAIREG